MGRREELSDYLDEDLEDVLNVGKKKKKKNRDKQGDALISKDTIQVGEEAKEIPEVGGTYVVDENFSGLDEKSPERAEFVRPIGEYFIRVFEASDQYKNLSEQQVRKLHLPEDFVGKSLDWDTFNNYTYRLKEEKGIEFTEIDFENIWREVMKDVSRDLAVHGMYNNGAWITMTDTDGYGAKFMMEAAGLRSKETKWHFVAKGNVYGVIEGVSTINADTSRVESSEGKKSIEGSWLEKIEVDGKVAYVLMLDHHANRSTVGTSATRAAYEGFIAMGLIDRNNDFDKLVDFVTKVDNGQEFEFPLGISKREFFKQHFAETIWGAHSKMGASRSEYILKHFRSGGTAMDILSHQQMKDMRLIFTIKEKTKTVDGKKEIVSPKTRIDYHKELQNEVDIAMKRLEELETEGKIADIPGYGKILVDEGGLMGQFGSEAAKACGYDGCLIWNKKTNSFKLTTSKKLDVVFDIGMKVRDHMWMLPESQKQELTYDLDSFLKVLSKSQEVKWQKKKIIGAEQQVVVEPTVDKEKTEKYFWYDGIGKDLEMATRYIKPGTEDFEKKIKEKEDVQKKLEDLMGNGLKDFFQQVKSDDPNKRVEMDKAYWASMFLEGDGKPSDGRRQPWGDTKDENNRLEKTAKENALNFLKTRLRIDKQLAAEGGAEPIRPPELAAKALESVPAAPEIKNVDWREKLMTDPNWQTLMKEADPEKMEAKMQEFAGMDEKLRNNETTVLRALVKIKSENLKTPEAIGLWEKHKNRLGRLGLMV